MKTTFINLAAQAEKFRRHNRQGSYKTKERYYEAFLRFLRFTAERFHLEKLANLSSKHLAAYVADMQRRRLSPATIKTELSAIRFWHDQIPNARYALPDNQELALERRVFGEQERTWSYREFNWMIGECWKAERPDFEVCIVIGRYAGLRIHEVMRMDTAIARAALQDGFLTIKGKGGKVREIPINETIRIELAALLKITPPGQKLFVPAGWDTHSVIHELEAFIRRHRDAVKDEGSERPMTFHGLRHTCAADWYRRLTREGKTPHEACLQVSRWLGHERAEITRIYLAGSEGKPDSYWNGGDGDA